MHYTISVRGIMSFNSIAKRHWAIRLSVHPSVALGNVATAFESLFLWNSILILDYGRNVVWCLQNSTSTARREGWVTSHSDRGGRCGEEIQSQAANATPNMPQEVLSCSGELTVTFDPSTCL